MFLIKAIAEAANTTTRVPATDANRAFFAMPSFSGAPSADRNKTPVASQKIITAPMATGQATLFTTFVTMPPMVCAPTTPGRAKTPNKDRNNIFLFIDRIPAPPWRGWPIRK